MTAVIEAAVQNLMVEEDVTQQQCKDCGFQGTEKRVKIHCMQHFCKYLRECKLIKYSRHAVYDHQVSKNRTEEHGGVSKRIYCVDRPSYPAFCLAMDWEDPPPFGETRPNRRGRFGRQETPPAPTHTFLTKKNIRARLEKQHSRPLPEPEVSSKDPHPYSINYRIP